MTDPELQKAVETALRGEVRLGRGIRVAVHRGEIELRGDVESLAEKRLATNMVRRMRTGDAPIRDRMRLAGPQELTDAQIAEHVLDAFMQDGALRHRAFHADVRQGVVTLAGTTDNLEEKRLAGVLAWWIPGVADVDNQIVVEPPQEGTEADLVDAIRIVFEKDMLVPADRIGIIVRGACVILIGTVGSEEARLAAEHDAYFTWGVEEVVNRLTVQPG